MSPVTKKNLALCVLKVGAIAMVATSGILMTVGLHALGASWGLSFLLAMIGCCLLGWYERDSDLMTMILKFPFYRS